MRSRFFSTLARQVQTFSSVLHEKQLLLKPIRVVAFDGAGTTGDPFSVAPVKSFDASLRSHRISMPLDKVRGPMGIGKIAHIKELLRLVNGSAEPDDTLVQSIYTLYLKQQEDELATTVPVPGMPNVLRLLQSAKINVALNTAYSRKEADIFLHALKKYGMHFDYSITSSEVIHSRPHPAMLHRIMDYFGIETSALMVVGDTEADIIAGKKAHCVTVGLASYSSLLQVNSLEEGEHYLSKDELAQRREHAKATLLKAGADFVLDEPAQVFELVSRLNQEAVTETQRRVWIYS